MESATLNTAEGAVSASAIPGATSFYLDQTKTGVFRVDSGFDLDRYMYRSNGPLDFSIDVSGNFGPVDAAGHPVAGNVLFNKTGRLTLRVFDVDDDYAGSTPYPERDLVGRTAPYWPEPCRVQTASGASTRSGSR